MRPLATSSAHVMLILAAMCAADAWTVKPARAVERGSAWRAAESRVAKAKLILAQLSRDAQYHAPDGETLAASTVEPPAAAAYFRSAEDAPRAIARPHAAPFGRPPPPRSL
ncbi:MAG: hypothetical protein SFV18_19355 [Bryobacteraceae bacterium]|nr:hypothetical protein [Bryobacteraceae bacterium]